MESKWDTYSLTDLYSISSGLSKKREEFGFGYPFLTFKDVFHNIFLPAELTELANTNEKEQQKCSIEAGDIFLTRTSEKSDELGLSSVALKDYPNATFNGFTKRLRPNELCKNILIPEYAAFYMRSPKFRNQVTSFSSMTTRASLNNEMISKLTIDIPPLITQKNIIAVLFNLLEKEKTNKKSITVLEEISQTLFKHWFIDFEFPNEQGQPYKSSGGEMMESELGTIPKGWYVDTLDSIGEFKNGKKILASHRREDAENRIFGSNGIIGYTDLTLQEEPCIIVGRVGANCGSVQISISSCWVTDNAIIATVKEFKYFSFLYRILSQSSLKERAGGSAQPLINQNILKGIKVISPPSNLIEDYNEISYKNARLADTLQSENDKLEQLRDTLLPRLLSGELEIPDELVVH